MPGIEEIDDAEFSARERKELRTLLRDKQRTRWLVQSIRIVAIWIASVLGAILLVYSVLQNTIRGFGGGAP